jgi:hypothetical protein
MGQEFEYDVFQSHSAKDETVVRPLAERLQQDGLKMWFDEWEIGKSTGRNRGGRSELHASAFSLQPLPAGPIKGCLAQFLHIKPLPKECCLTAQKHADRSYVESKRSDSGPRAQPRQLK